jgi:CheY-like chemotaxis protein
LSEALRARGLHVLNSGDGAKALRLAAERRVDLALLDVEMPGRDGARLLTALRRQHRSLPVIAMVGPNSHGGAAEALREGARACLRKPFDLSRLFQEVELALGTPHMG